MQYLCVKWFLILLIFLLKSIVRAEEYCYATDPEGTQVKHFSTKSAYQFTKGSANSKQYFVQDCSPIKVWLLSRHGTRLPTDKEIKKLRKLIKLRNNVVKNYADKKLGPLCEKDLQLIQNWKWDHTITEDFDQFLTSQGWTDLRKLAKSYQKAFPSIFDKKYSAEKFKFEHTQKQRTQASFRAFTEGLFGENAYDKIKLPPIPDREILLKPYKYCPAWSNENYTIEQSKFIAMPIYQQMIGDVSERLGFNRSGESSLTNDDIKLIWDMCRYDQAWVLNNPSAWCSAFTKTHVKILEYSSDLSYYYEFGYGSTMSKNLPCLLMQNMLTYLEYPDKNQKVFAYFAHSAIVNLFLRAMGAFEDAQPLRADNFEQMNNRQYKTSQNAPFTANLAAVKYECNGSTDSKIRFFINERPLTFNWCNENGTICNWSDVAAKYKYFSQANCEEMFCETDLIDGVKRMPLSARIALDLSQIDDEDY